MGGVNANVEPATSFNVRLALPAEFVTVTVNEYEFAAGALPLMVPDAASMVSPSGRSVASNLSGACPVVGTVYKKSLAGVQPMIAGPRMRGVAGASAVEMVTSVCAA